MSALLFGAASRLELLDSGDFFCPVCASRRDYQRVEVRRAIRVFGLRIGRLGREGEYVECGRCLSTFRPEVLAYDAGDATLEVMAEYQRAMRRVLALMVVSDGKVKDVEVRKVQHVFEALCGRRLSKREVLDEVQEVSEHPTTVARYLARVAGHLNDYGKEQLLRAAATISRSDGDLDAKEVEVVWRLGAVLRLDRGRIERLHREIGTATTG